MLKLLPQPLRDKVGGLLFWVVGVPLLVIVGGGIFLIAGQAGGVLGVVGLAGAIVATIVALGAILSVAGKAFMTIGTRLEPVMGESAASAIAFLIVGGALVASLWLAIERPWEQHPPAALDPTNPMTDAECRTYVALHPEYKCIPASK